MERIDADDPRLDSMCQPARALPQTERQSSQPGCCGERLGPPGHTQELTTGETLWSYEYRNGDCKAYVLTFDRAKVLRDWKEQKC
jgi:hypothetical protein